MPANQSPHPYTEHRTADATRPRQKERVERWVEEIDQSRLFGEVSVILYPWSEWYATERYLQLLETYSDHFMLPKMNKQGLYDGITDILAGNGHGVEKSYLAMLFLARKA